MTAFHCATMPDEWNEEPSAFGGELSAVSKNNHSSGGGLLFAGS